MLERKISLFRDDGLQALRIPKEFELPDDEVMLRKTGDSLTLEPIKRESLLEYLERAEPVDEEWPHIDDPLPEPVNL